MIINTNYDENDPDIYIRLFAWHIRFEKRKELKKELHGELMFIAWHSKIWWDFCMSEDEEKEIEPIFT